MLQVAPNASSPEVAVLEVAPVARVRFRVRDRVAYAWYRPDTNQVERFTSDPEGRYSVGLWHWEERLACDAVRDAVAHEIERYTAGGPKASSSSVPTAPATAATTRRRLCIPNAGAAVLLIVLVSPYFFVRSVFLGLRDYLFPVETVQSALSDNG